MKIAISRFPGKVKKKKHGTSDMLIGTSFPSGKCYKSVVARCCTLRLSGLTLEGDLGEEVAL